MGYSSTIKASSPKYMVKTCVESTQILVCCHIEGTSKNWPGIHLFYDFPKGYFSKQKCCTHKCGLLKKMESNIPWCLIICAMKKWPYIGCKSRTLTDSHDWTPHSAERTQNWNLTSLCFHMFSYVLTTHSRSWSSSFPMFSHQLFLGSGGLRGRPHAMSHRVGTDLGLRRRPLAGWGRSEDSPKKYL